MGHRTEFGYSPACSCSTHPLLPLHPPSPASASACMMMLMFSLGGRVGVGQQHWRLHGHSRRWALCPSGNQAAHPQGNWDQGPQRTTGMCRRPLADGHPPVPPVGIDRYVCQCMVSSGLRSRTGSDTLGLAFSVRGRVLADDGRLYTTIAARQRRALKGASPSPTKKPSPSPKPYPVRTWVRVL